MSTGFEQELWTCPICGHEFVTRNAWHSCSRYELDHHFGSCPPVVRETFDRFLELVGECGPATVIPQKTRIAVMVKVRFAACMIRKRYLLVHLWLTRRADHPALEKTEVYSPRAVINLFRFSSPSDIDDEFRELVRESYRVGLREHIDNSR